MNAILLLAAGASTRMGQSKQLLSVQGEVLLVRSVKAALSSAPIVAVVLGARFEEHQEALKGLPVIIIENKDWVKGMGNSLKRGLTTLMQYEKGIDAVTVMVCDQPGVSAIHLARLSEISKQTAKSIIASSYAGTLGVPALFKSERFSDLLAVADEGGASKLIRRWPQYVEAVDFPEGITDLDTPADYMAYTTRKQNRP